MADWLLLQLPRTATDAVRWLQVDAHGVAQGAVQSGALDEAGLQAAGRRVCVLVPAEDVLTCDVTLPVKGGARALQAAPFALEEQLVADIEQQHFALGPRDADSGRTQVAVVSRALMDDWLRNLAAAGIQPQLLCSVAALLPSNPSQSLALLDHDTLCARLPGAHSVAQSVPATPLAEALTIALGGAPLAGIELLLQVTPEAWERHGAEIEALRAQMAHLGVQQLGAGALPWLALQLPTGSPLNLLQGDYQRRDAGADVWRRWRLAALLAGALVLLSFAGQAMSLWKLQRAEAEVDVALADLAAQIFPGDRSTANLRGRAQQLLAGQSGDPLLLACLQSLAQAMGGNAAISALSFRDGATELKLRANDAQAIERVLTSLRSGGWKAELVSGGNVSGGYEGRLQVRRSGGGT